MGGGVELYDKWPTRTYGGGGADTLKRMNGWTSMDGHPCTRPRMRYPRRKREGQLHGWAVTALLEI